MKNNKGFAISSVIYAMLVLFLGLVLLILGNLASRKAMFDKEKNEILMRFNGDESGVCKPSASLSNSSAVLVTGDSNKFAIGAEYKCELGDGLSRIFYVLEETSTKVSLIMSENLGDNVAWVSKDDYIAAGGTESEYGSYGNINKGPITVKKALAERTQDWHKLNQSQIKLPTADQIANASGKTFSNTTVSELAPWLYGNLSSSKIIGYWTSSAISRAPSRAFSTYYDGRLFNLYSVYSTNMFGIRPVIELSKSAFDEPVLCTAKTAATVGNVSKGAYAYGDEYTCELGDGDAKTFYVLETKGNNVSLIMNANVGPSGKAVTSKSADKGLTAWVSKDDYIKAGGKEADYGSNGNSSLGALTIKRKLGEFTSTWTKLKQSQITLPSGKQIATAGGDTTWSSNKWTGTKLSSWLYSNLISSAAPYGYWTSDFYASKSYQGWLMENGGYLDVSSVYHDDLYGIRPVITISKLQIQ